MFVNYSHKELYVGPIEEYKQLNCCRRRKFEKKNLLSETFELLRQEDPQTTSHSNQAPPVKSPSYFGRKFTVVAISAIVGGVCLGPLGALLAAIIAIAVLKIISKTSDNKEVQKNTNPRSSVLDQIEAELKRKKDTRSIDELMEIYNAKKQKKD